MPRQPKPPPEPIPWKHEVVLHLNDYLKANRVKVAPAAEIVDFYPKADSDAVNHALTWTVFISWPKPSDVPVVCLTAEGRALVAQYEGRGA